MLSALLASLFSAITVVHDVPPSSADLGRRKDLSPSPFSPFLPFSKGSAYYRLRVEKERITVSPCDACHAFGHACYGCLGFPLLKSPFAGNLAVGKRKRATAFESYDPTSAPNLLKLYRSYRCRVINQLRYSIRGKKGASLFIRGFL